MKLLSALAVTAVSAGRIKRQFPGDDGWTLIPANLGITEGTHYKLGGNGNGVSAHAYCADQGGSLPKSTNSADIISYYTLSGSIRYFWTGFKKTAGTWNADPTSGDAIFDIVPGNNPDEAEGCAMYHYTGSGQVTIYQNLCTQGNGPFLCLKTVSAAPAEINSVVDAWNDMVTFPNAATHGCQCLNLLSDADQRYPGQPRDELDHVCLDWQNAIKCQRFEGGICGPKKEDELPSYTNYADCTLNSDPCAAALCEINRKFATDVNNLNGVITPEEVEQPDVNCARAQAGPKYDSCCFTDIYSSIRYDSVASQCVDGAVEPKPTEAPYIPEDHGWTLIPANLKTTEGTHYKLKTPIMKGHGRNAHAYCAEQGGFLPLSTNSADIKKYRTLSGSKNYYWAGFRKTDGTWNVDPRSGDANTFGFTDNARGCAMYMYNGSGTTNIYETNCLAGNAPFLCLQNFSTGST